MNEGRLVPAKLSKTSTAQTPRETSNARMHFQIPRRCLFMYSEFLYLCKKRACNVLVLTLTPLTLS
jgi:hypothetical protein